MPHPTNKKLNGAPKFDRVTVLGWATLPPPHPFCEAKGWEVNIQKHT